MIRWGYCQSPVRTVGQLLLDGVVVDTGAVALVVVGSIVVLVVVAVTVVLVLAVEGGAVVVGWTVVLAVEGDATVLSVEEVVEVLLAGAWQMAPR